MTRPPAPLPSIFTDEYVRALERVIGRILPVVGSAELMRAALEWGPHPLSAWLNLVFGLVFLLGFFGMLVFRRSRLRVIRLTFFGATGVALAFDALGFQLLPPGLSVEDTAYLVTARHIYLPLVMMVCSWLVFPSPWSQRLALGVGVLSLGLKAAAGVQAVFSGLATPGGVVNLLVLHALVVGSFYLLLQVLTVVYMRQARLEQERGVLERFAHVDDLTGLLNRRAFDHALGAASGQASRHLDPLSLIAFDLDAFKRVNDAYGHPVGDRVLRELAALARRELRAGDLLARWGGEEFVWLLPGADLGAAARAAERLRAAVEAHDFRVGRVTLSLGVAGWRSGDDPQALFRRADDLLYTAKRGGRNRVEVDPGPPP
ncbi:GGDEF domain-containing protein [Deinococcus planocerae]|uniref:GGDEF domain-containing protein n=1 Tax=Deinococcus planocerae TaxID=1737569 RepID=UPI000C7E9A6E|nr:GGDEF domain-containing protein [Deinococcus planocerae]